MKLKFFILLIILNWQYTKGQNWTWVHGKDTANKPGIYGMQGVSSSTVRPGARHLAAAWTDNTGKFWMFGGLGVGSTTVNGYFDDMWKYDPATNEWTWVAGTSTLLPSAVTHTPSFSTTYPMPRSCAATWVDQTGNLWMYGGHSNGYLADLWKYTISTNQWTLVAGTTVLNIAATGNLGIPGVSVTPGSRGCAYTWKDQSGNFWIYGGADDNVWKGDIYTYNPVTGQWTLKKRLPGPFGYGIYGTKGVTSPTVYPGVRSSGQYWTDLQDNLWLYGGLGSTSGTIAPTWGNLDDLWKYSIVTNQWTWVGGTDAANNSPVYGSLGVESITNTPGGRANAVSWTDPSGVFMMFGGNNNRNDLWRFNATTGGWTWLKGSSGTLQPGSYGSIGVSSPTNVPGYRDGAIGFLGSTNSLWLFGGLGSAASNFGYLCDLWRLDYCGFPSPINTTGANSQACAGNSTSLSVVSPGSLSWYASPSSTLALGIGSLYVTPVLSAGTYTYFVNAATCTQNPIRTPITVTVQAIPVVSVASGSFCAGSTFTLQPSGASSYTYLSAGPVVSPSVISQYSVAGFSSFGCPSSNTAVATVSVMGNPTVTVNSGSVCQSTPFTFTPGGAASYSFSSGSAVVSPTSTGIYTITGFAAYGCSAVAISTVVVYPSPSITAVGGTICPGFSFTISPAGATTYTYSGGSPVVNPLVTTSYSVIGSNSLGCISNSPALVQVVVALQPTVSLNSGTICSGNIHHFVPQGASSYSISGGSYNVSPLVASIYSLTGIGSNGCVSANTATAMVTVHPLPQITASGGSICLGQQFTIAPTGAFTYTVSGLNFVVSPSVSTSYSVSGTNSLGCGSANPVVVQVTVVALPVVTVNSGSVCAGSPFTIIPSGAANYSFSSGTPIVYPVVNSSYSVFGSSNAGCISATPAISNVTVFAVPVLNITSTADTICLGNSVTLTASGASNYTWAQGDTTQSVYVAPASSTVYSVTGFNQAGCAATFSFLQHVDACTGLLRIEGSADISLFPNPASGAFCISIPPGKSDNLIVILDETGSRVFEQRIGPGLNNISVKSLASGMYMILIYAEGQRVAHTRMVLE